MDMDIPRTGSYVLEPPKVTYVGPVRFFQESNPLDSPDKQTSSQIDSTTVNDRFGMEIDKHFVVIIAIMFKIPRIIQILLIPSSKVIRKKIDKRRTSILDSNEKIE